MSESDLEKPRPDEQEQQRDLTGDDEDDEEPAALSFEVNEADAAEQHRVVALDEDDYR